jgi:hypothetical protein
MDDVERLFRQLVDVLAARAPDRVAAPFQISELYQSILPYRKYRKQLGFESNEDYEMAVLRLLAGEAGYATVEPSEVKDQLVLEAEAVNPNPRAFREFAAARVKLNERAVHSVLGAARAYEPPAPSPTVEPKEQVDEWAQFAPPAAGGAEPAPKTPVFEAVEEEPATVEPEPQAAPEEPVSEHQPQQVSGSLCRGCGRTLPAHRAVWFCPFCGSRIGTVTCTACGDEIEVGWRFCVTCGRSTEEN